MEARRRRCSKVLTGRRGRRRPAARPAAGAHSRAPSGRDTRRHGRRRWARPRRGTAATVAARGAPTSATAARALRRRSVGSACGDITGSRVRFGPVTLSTKSAAVTGRNCHSSLNSPSKSLTIHVALRSHGLSSPLYSPQELSRRAVPGNCLCRRQTQIALADTSAGRPEPTWWTRSKRCGICLQC